MGGGGLVAGRARVNEKIFTKNPNLNFFFRGGWGGGGVGAGWGGW